MKHFWSWVRDADTSERTLYLEGPIAEESWFGDEVTPEQFKSELFDGEGPIKVHINSPGGDVFAASKIYTMLMDYPYEVNVQIDALAASAASVIAMAGTHVAMSPTSMMMIHNPWTVAYGDSAEMKKAITMLDEVKQAIINAYAIKTGLSNAKLSHLMDDETWMSAHKAYELGFCDEVLFSSDEPENASAVADFSFSRTAVSACLMNRLIASVSVSDDNTETVDPVGETPEAPDAAETPTDNRVDASDYDRRLMQKKYL